MIVNLTKLNCLSREPYYATMWGERLRGMIGRQFEENSFDAMVFNRCNMVHTFFMSIPLDVVFVDKENSICALHHAVAPWTPLLRCRQAKAVIELPAGTVEQTGTEIGDKIDLNSELTSDTVKKLKTSGNLGTIRPISLQRGGE